ncbi:MAG: RNA-binding domain-containing protein [Candidatus Thorarchaeota archaeon]
MPFVERVEARAYSRATEVVERVKKAILALFPEELAKKIAINSVETEGHARVPISVITAQIRGKRQALATFEYIIERLPDTDKQMIAQSIERRLNEKCILFFRIDKQDAFRGNIHLATRPDMISVKVYLREYPKCNKREIIDFINSALGITERN